MGKLLQIRVSAWTYREEDVLSTWPALARLAWPRPLYPGERRGVLELAGALENELLYADWDNRLREKLKAGVDEAAQLKMRLEAALADWAPREANRLSELLEDALSELERNASTLLNI